VAKVPELVGQLSFWIDRVSGRRRTLIEYHDSPRPAGRRGTAGR
jgi:hypothetical protein